jgi:hypothetical protein
VQDVDGGPPVRRCSRIRERPPSILRKCRHRAPWGCCQRIQKHSSSTLRNVDGGPLGVLSENPGAPTINVKKYRQRAPLVGADGEFRSSHHQCLEMSTAGPWWVLTKNTEVPTINIKKRRQRRPWGCSQSIDGEPPVGC